MAYTQPEMLDMLERAVTVGAGLWATVRFIFTPLLTQTVRKVVGKELARVDEMDRELSRHEGRMHQLEERVKDHDRVFKELPLLRETLAETKTAIESLGKLLDRVMDRLDENTKEIAAMHGFQEGVDRRRPPATPGSD